MNTHTDSQQSLQSLSDLQFCRIFFNKIFQSNTFLDAVRSKRPAAILLQSFISLTDNVVAFVINSGEYSFNEKELDKELWRRRQLGTLPPSPPEEPWLFSFETQIKTLSPVWAGIFCLAVLKRHCRENAFGTEFFLACELLPLPTLPENVSIEKLIDLSRQCAGEYKKRETKRLCLIPL